MSAVPSLLPLPRKPAAAQYNWISGNLDITPEQLDLPLLPIDDILLPLDNTVTLLATDPAPRRPATTTRRLTSSLVFSHFTVPAA